MGYTRTGLGDLSDAIGKAIGVVGGAVTNPYLPEILCRVKQVEAARSGKIVGVCEVTPPVDDSLGIRKFMLPIRGYAYAEQHQWVYPVAIGLVVGVPFLLGYMLGKK